MKKLRIATYYDPLLSNRNDGAPLYFTEALKRMGHDVVHLSGKEMSSHELQQFGKFDLHVWVDWGEDGLNVPYKLIEKLPSPSVYIPCDTHITDAGKDYRFKRADNSDWVFFNQRNGLDLYREHIHAQISLGGFANDQVDSSRLDKVSWLPCAVEPIAYPNKPIAIKKYDIGFVGYVTFEKRAIALDRMFKEFPNFFYGQRLFEAAAEEYRKSKIVFNTAANQDLNMRNWESLATDSFCLTEYSPYMEDVFENKKHLVWYHNMDEAVELAKYYLAHDEEREAIAKAGGEWVRKVGTYENRAKEILNRMGLSDEPFVPWTTNT